MHLVCILYVRKIILLLKTIYCLIINYYFHFPFFCCIYTLTSHFSFIFMSVCLSVCCSIGHGAARLDAHTTERAATALPSRRHHSRQDNGRQSFLGRRENSHHYLQLHARLLLSHGLQAHPLRLRVGSEQQGHGQQPSRLPPLSLREGPDASLRSFPWLLHGPCSRTVELQLYG